MASLIQEIVGHQRVKGLLLKTLQQDALSGCFLLAGPEGVGKKKVALAMAQYFLCQRGNGCGECGSCRRVERNEHESLIMMEPENNIIKLEEAQKVKEFLRLKSLSEKRFIIIDEAQKMNLSCSNALLKTFEEPPDGVYFLLVSSQPKALMATIRSRSRVFRFSYLEQEAVNSLLIKWKWHSKNFLQRGQLHLVAKYVNEKVDESFIESVFELIQKVVLQKDFWEKSDWRSQFKDKNQFQQFLFYMQIILRDLRLRKIDQDSENIILAEHLKSLDALVHLDDEKINFLEDFINDLYQQISWSPDPIMAIESMAYKGGQLC